VLRPYFHTVTVAHIDLDPADGNAVFRQRFREVLHSFTILVR
jgi:hypothetical protein